MGLVTAVRENRMWVVPFALLAIIGWLALNLLRVWEAMDPFAGFGGGYVGHAAVSGYVGLAVMAITLLVGVYLYAEAGETGPTPERFPPR